MSDLQTTPRQSRALPTKGQATQSKYSPRTLESTRTRFAGLFTAFGVGGEPSTSSFNSGPTTVWKAPIVGLEGDNERSTVGTGVLPSRPPGSDFRAPQVLSPSMESDESVTSQSMTQHRLPPEASTSAHFSTFWSFLSPTTSQKARMLAPTSSVRQRIRTKAMMGKRKGKEEEADDFEWDEARSVDFEDDLAGLDLSRTSQEPAAQLPLPDELMLQAIHALPPSLALLHTLSLTSKAFASLAASQSLWKRLYLSQTGWHLPNLPRDGAVNYRELYKTRVALERQWLYDPETNLEEDAPVPQKMILRGHTDSVYACQISGQWLITGSRDRSINVWRLPPIDAIWSERAYQDEALVKTVESAHDGSVLSLRFEEYSRAIPPDDVSEGDGADNRIPPGYLVTGSSDSTIGIWRIDWANVGGVIDVVRESTIRGHIAGVLNIVLTEEHIVSASKDATVKVWSRATHECLYTLTEHSGPVNDISINQSETQLVSVSGDGRLVIWDLHSGQVIKVIEGGARGLACVHWNGNYLLVGSNDRLMKLFHAGMGDLVRTFEGHMDLVRTVAFDANVGVAVSGSYDKTIRIWNLRTGALLRALPAHSSLVFGVRIDTTRIVSVSHDHTIVVQQLGAGLPHIELCS